MKLGVGVKMKDRTTIQIPASLRKELKDLKKFKRETYEETLKRLIKNARRKK